MKVRKVFALSILATSVALAAGCSSDDDGDDTDDMMEPGTGEPGTGEPGTGEPGTGEPGTGEPGTGEPTSPEATATGNSIIDVARGTDADGDGTFEGGADALSSLVAQLGNYPDLVDALDDESMMYTVFAPNNDAFAAADLSGLDEAAIRNVLTYHVVAGEPAAELTAGMLPTLQGSMLEIRAVEDGDEDDTNDTFEVVDSTGMAFALTPEGTVTAPENGTVYVINGILTPGEAPTDPGMTDPDPTDPPTGTEGSAFAAIEGDESLSSFETLVTSSTDFNLSLNEGNTNFITFAPTNEAYAAITPPPVEARTFTVSSISTDAGVLDSDGEFVGTTSGENAGRTFVVSGTAEGETLTVNGVPAVYISTGGPGGVVIKYGPEVEGSEED